MMSGPCRVPALRAPDLGGFELNLHPPAFCKAQTVQHISRTEDMSNRKNDRIGQRAAWR